MSFGLSQSTLERLTGVFKDFPEVDSVVIYGSRAKGNYKPGSDIDLTLRGDSITQRRCDEIADCIDELLLPYTVDLSVFSTLNHPELEAHIERVGKELYRKVGKPTDWPVTR
jgi:uncharacterized protein